MKGGTCIMIVLQNKLEQRFDLLLDQLHVGSGFEACYHSSLAIDQKLGEIPLDVGIIFVVWVSFAEHIVEQRSNFVIEVKTSEWLLLFQVGEQRRSFRAVDIDFLKLRELSTKIELAETVDFLFGARSLLAELVARKIENFQSLLTISLVERF